MKFDGVIMIPALEGLDRAQVVHMPLYLTKDGAEKVTMQSLRGLRLRTGQELTFAVDARVVVRLPGESAARATGCYIKGYRIPGNILEFEAWVYADAVCREFGFDVDISRQILRPANTTPCCRSKIAA